MTEDVELLRCYVEQKSEAAFTTLVQRHLDVLYACALRRVGGDSALAEEVTQQVFTALAQSAANLTRHPFLLGWLYTTAKFAAGRAVRDERRRKARHSEAHSRMNEASHTDPVNLAEWDKLHPVLDAAMDELSESDRDAVLMRFFQERSFAEIGVKLNLTENAARMRVERALDKLHALLARRGVTSTAAGLAIALSHQPSIAAPATLAAKIGGIALAGAALGTGLPALSFFHFAMNSKLALASLTAALALGFAGYQIAENRNQRAQLAAMIRERDEAQSALQRATEKLNAEAKRAAAIEEDNGKLLTAIATAKPALGSQPDTKKEPLTHDIVEARYRNAQAMARNGQSAEALREFLWCYDEGMPRVSGYGGVRNSFLLSDIFKLSNGYPPALEALRERRDAMLKRVLASTTDFEATQSYSSINRTLGENGKTIEVFDQFAENDPRRKNLGSVIFEQLLEQHRYADAARVRSFAEISRQFEMAASLTEREIPPSIKNPEALRGAQRQYLVNSATQNIEMLAGSGDLAHAKELTDRLLAKDTSPETKKAVQDSLGRAGHADLLNATP